MSMMRIAIMTVILALLGGASFADSRILSQYGGGSREYLSRYSGGGNYYYNPRRGGGPTGYTGANAPIHRNPYPVRRINAWGEPVVASRALVFKAPCGNINRVQPRHCAPTLAWDNTFRSVYR